MGTLNITAVMADGEYKVAQYGQWDGYPSCAGVGILEFARNPESLESLKAALSKVRFLDREGVDKEFFDAYSANAPEWSNNPDNRTDEQLHWFKTYMNRDLGYKVLSNIAGSEDSEIILGDSLSFVGDSLFCEWAYVIDYDANTFEVYKGYNKNPVTDGRFVSGDPMFADADDDYEPVKLVKMYALDALPAPEEFEADIGPIENGE